MFRSLKFTALAQPIVAHSHWNDQTRECTLWLMASPNDAINVSSKLPIEQARSLDALRWVLKHDVESGTVAVEGNVGMVLTNQLVQYHDTVGQYTHSPMEPELLGTWGTLEKDGHGRATYMWWHQDGGYQVVNINSLQQAEDLIKSLTWLGESRQKTLIQETKKWSAHALPSIDEPQKISGAMAELLCKASVIARQWESRRAMA